ncbi:MAG TPA: AraC family transcriptional regulator [Polyangiaceae bacterium]|nr:AraC family transcriptional regulator [Polyangiaceae bacterium]
MSELGGLMDEIEQQSGYQEILDADFGRFGWFCSRRRERFQVKSPPEPVLALVLAGRKRVQGLSIGPGELIIIPSGFSFEVVNVPESADVPYRSFVVHVAPQAATLLEQREVASACSDVPWSATRPRVLRPTRSTLLALLHFARTLSEPEVHLELLRHRLEDVLLSILLAVNLGAESAPRSHAASDPVAAIRRLIRRDPAHSWLASQAAQQLGMSEPTLRRRLAAAQTSFREILTDERMRLARSLLRDPSLSVMEVALRCGYQSPSRFAAQFARIQGTLPSRFAELGHSS